MDIGIELVRSINLGKPFTARRCRFVVMSPLWSKKRKVKGKVL